MTYDVTTGRASGKTCTMSNGKPIIWNGHLCEGANVTPPHDINFLMWTRCGSADVPAGSAHEGAVDEVTCPRCAEIALNAVR